MLTTLFTMILAGCGDGGSECEVLERLQVEAVSLAACEAQLDARMAQLTHPWPEYAGICVDAAAQVALPEGWMEPPLLLASGR